MHGCTFAEIRPSVLRSERLSRSPFCISEIVSALQDDLFVRTRVTIKTRTFRNNFEKAVSLKALVIYRYEN